MVEKSLDGADKFALKELMEYALTALVPDHTRTVVEPNEQGVGNMVKRPCPGSQISAVSVHLEHVGHATLPTDIQGFCSYHCGVLLKWDFTEHAWKV